MPARSSWQGAGVAPLAACPGVAAAFRCTGDYSMSNGNPHGSCPKRNAE